MFKQDVDQITALLDHTRLPANGVSFQGQGLKFNTAKDVQVVIDSIESCGPGLEYLNLEGNTLGVEAAKALAISLENCSKLTKALWKDMFTGRSKDEIPIALGALSKGLIKAGAKLEILDLSDNAGGPIGIKGIVDLIQSPVCYSLKELKLNNMGLGVTGGKMLCEALMACIKGAQKAGTPMELKVFIAGRNRLENPGATELSKVFAELGTLEEVQMPQNGIYYQGIEKLCKGLSKNVNLSLLNLNDNTLTERGAIAIASMLKSIQDIKHLDLGDCLIKNSGAQALAKAFEIGHEKIEFVDCTRNEIDSESGEILFEVLAQKPNIQQICLNGNSFGHNGCEKIKALAVQISSNILDSLSEDEGSDVENYEQDDEDYDDEYEIIDNEEDENYSDDDESYDERDESENVSPMIRFQIQNQSLTEIHDQEPSLNVIGVSNVDANLISELISKTLPIEKQIDEMLKTIMYISQTYKAASDKQNIINCTMTLYEEMFKVAKRDNRIGTINNMLPAYLGLIKFEFKSQLAKYFDNGSSLELIKIAMTKDFFPPDTLTMINFFLNTPVK